LTSIYAPLLVGNPILMVNIFANPNLAKVDLSALTEAFEIQIFGNPKLVELSAEQVVVKLPELTTVVAFLGIGDNDLLEQLSLPKLSTTNKLSIVNNENLKGISIPVLTTSSNGFEVFNNPRLQTLCAPNLEDGGDVCIGDEFNQLSLDADLSLLVTGTFTSGLPFCYGSGSDPPTNQLNAEKVCGKEGNGLFSDVGCPSAGCPETP